MDFLELAKQRYSVRAFAPKKIEQEKLDRIIEAGMAAPTAVNFQPQRILVIREQQGLAKLAECTRFTFGCTAALLVCYDKEIAWKRRYDGKCSGDIDAAIVTTHMMLEAEALGIGSTWVMSFDPQKMREIFQIPEQFMDVALLVLGYPSEDAEPSLKHMECVPTEQIVSYEHFQNIKDKVTLEMSEKDIEY